MAAKKTRSNKKKADKASSIKPWEKLGLSRQQYFDAHPWTKSGMKRKVFEEILLLMPDDFIEETKREGEAEKLIEAIFGNGVLNENSK